jgi:hypothetical protein
VDWLRQSPPAEDYTQIAGEPEQMPAARAVDGIEIDLQTLQSSTGCRQGYASI